MGSWQHCPRPAKAASMKPPTHLRIFSVNAWLYQFSFRLFPGTCLLCGDPTRRTLDLCAGCERDLPLLGDHCRICSLPLPTAGIICGGCLRSPPAFSRALVPFRYEPPLNRLIHRFKHSGDLASGRVLGHLLSQHLNTSLTQRPTSIVPVPLHWGRTGRRGFNQSLELANHLSQALGIPCASRLATRIKPTPAQQLLDRGARRRNLRGAFAVRENVDGQSFAIVDDVVTTGSTADSLATALRKAGAANVQLWALARTSLAK